MKFTLALLALFAVVAVSNTAVIQSSYGNNLYVGRISAGDRLLYSQYVSSSEAGAYEDVCFRGNATDVITAIQAVQVGQSATAEITSGGVGTNCVTIRFSPCNGYGYYFLLEIWGYYC